MKLIKNRGLSFKLVLLFILTGLAMIIVLRLFNGGGFINRFGKLLKPHIYHYYQYIQQDIGTPPDLIKAQQLSDSLHLNIIIRGKDVHWSSNGTFPKKKLLLNQHHNGHPNFQIGMYQHHFVVRISNPSYTTLFINHRPNDLDSPWKILFHTLLGILLVLVLLYFFLRHMIHPIKEIQASVKRIGAGELDHRIRLNHHDELGDLSRDINAMADDIDNMLEAKRQLLLAISHELRSPITRAKVAISLMDNSNLKEGLSSDLNEMEAMISGLLEAEQLNHRHQALNLSEISIKSLITMVISNHFPNKTIQHHSATDFVAMIDIPRFQFVIKNLLGNALKYRKHPDDAVSISSQRTDAGWILRVEDKGIGIPKQHLNHLTEPFYRVDPSRDRKTGGYGLGLYLVNLITEAHHGKLTIESKEGLGTCIVIEWPRLS